MREKNHSEFFSGSPDLWEGFARAGRELAEFFLDLGDHAAAAHAFDDAFLDERRAHEARKRG